MLHFSNHFARSTRFILVAASLLLITACNRVTPAVTATPTNAHLETPATLQPTLEPTAATAKVILISDIGASTADLQKTEMVLTVLAARDNMNLVQADSLTTSDLTPEVKVVVWIGQAEGIGELAAGAPQVQFVAITSSALEPAVNLNIIHIRPEKAVFIAGYISTLIAPDWRGAGLLPSDGPLGDQVQAVFTNGGRFFCGRCAPAFAPVVLFPVSTVLPGNSPPSAWQAAFDELNKNIIEVLYVSNSAASPELLSALSEKGIILIGSQPPTADLLSAWAATVSIDCNSQLELLWPDLFANKPGQSLEAPVVLSDVDPAKLSPGRQELVNAMIGNLQDGTVNPFSVPPE
ncbi:MAG TPA: hypothetical protein VN452_03720 [Longilinea sp.]|nr:hypothetical protein [Longilinea sp.]